MLTVTSVLSAIAGLAYVGLFVLMSISAAAEIETIEKLVRLKENGSANITNTYEDLAASVEENELATVVFGVGAALTIPLVVAGLLALGGRGWARVLATVFMLPAVVVVTFGVIHDIADGHPENAFALVFTVPALVLTLLWWLPPTSRAMVAKRWRRAATHQGRPMPGRPYA
ncbi:hypothetical protein [Actinophytocola gossypii]|uniref:DUF1772 domain-containing protein n=1 Tax=Actinophytocola gossypii TaxID=2812003 RepID=A0ABT2J9K2_9PSEU|nr:hypothetical protein [Actinophytocola gossypii]MCT2584254.1 hypothetical protein [Actinophytocola gossypii]